MGAPADQGVEGTVAGAIELLARWARLSPDGVALAEFDYPLAQEAVLNGLEDRLRERAVPLHRIVLEQRTPAEEQVRRLIVDLLSLPAGVVSVSGFGNAFPDTVSLRESLLYFNYSRETLVHLPHKQIWWMTPAFAAEFSIEARELDRFFLLRARVTESDLRTGAGSWASRHAYGSPKL